MYTRKHRGGKSIFEIIRSFISGNKDDEQTPEKDPEPTGGSRKKIRNKTRRKTFDFISYLDSFQHFSLKKKKKSFQG